MEQFYPVLDNCLLFEGIKREHYSQMLGCLGARTMKVKRGAMVFAEGDPATGVGIVLSGGIQTVREDYLGNRSILSMSVPGQMFGEGFSCSGVDALPVSIVAAADSEVMIINCSHIMTICHHVCSFHNQMIRNLLRSVADSNMRLSQKVDILAKRTTREKVMAYLLSEAKLQGRDDFFIPYDRQELADYLGVERSAMSTVIGRLRSEGLIDVNRKWFRILH